MRDMGCVHAVRRGNKVPEDQLPRHVGELEDDPSAPSPGRSGERAAAGEKLDPLAELMWADFLRSHGVVIESSRRRHRKGERGRASNERGGSGSEAAVRVREADSAQGYRPLPRRLLSLCWSDSAKGMPGWVRRARDKKRV